MSDENMQNDGFNPNRIPPADGNLGGINPAMNKPFNDDAAFTGARPPFPSQPEVNEDAMNYNFDEMNDAQIQEPQHEVQLDADDSSNDPVTVRPVEFTPFDSYTPTNTNTNKNLELLMDVKLELTVELGRCRLPVKKVLELTRGSIIELDKVAGESVELFANGKHVANGEVVVIEDNFGLRITSITDPEERIKSL